MLEIEMKFPVADFDGVLAVLEKWGAVAGAVQVEADHYHNAPDRDFGRTDEALRLRRVGSRSRITYKGPRHPGKVKTRTEIEVPLADGDEPAHDFLRLLENLAYRPTAVVRKTRRPYDLERDGFDMQICLDEVEQVGRYVEVEIVAPADKVAAAQHIVSTVAGEMRLGAHEPRSYLQMLLEKRPG